jgi:hypothetical protein
MLKFLQVHRRSIKKFVFLNSDEKIMHLIEVTWVRTILTNVLVTSVSFKVYNLVEDCKLLVENINWQNVYFSTVAPMSYAESVEIG